MPNTIKLKKYVDVIVERNAAAAISPGHLIEHTTTANQVQVHATQDGDVTPVMIALENELVGGGITDAYAATDKVVCWVAQRGEEAYMKLANGENAAYGARLTSQGDGTLKVQDEVASAAEEYPEAVVAIALEAVDMSGSSAADPSGWIKVMVI